MSAMICIVLYIHFGTGHRSGFSANSLMSEFYKATFVNGSYDVRVCNHKTVKTYGPAGQFFEKSN